MVGCGPTSAMKPILILCMTTRPTEAAGANPVARQVQGVSSGGCIWWLRRHLRRWEHYRGCLLGARRRKFFEAKDTDGRRSAEMLAMVRELYAVEDEAKHRVAALLKEQPDANDDERHAIIRGLRQEFSVPILAKIKTWLDDQQKLVLPRSPMAQAITYVLNQWEALNVYTTQGYLNIDNNAAERALKRVAIGRKNWLFAGHDEAAKSAAIFTTLIASTQRHGVDPQAYLTGVLARIASMPVSQLGKLLPDRWGRLRPSEPLPP